jgi:hypothetical protein
MSHTWTRRSSRTLFRLLSWITTTERPLIIILMALNGSQNTSVPSLLLLLFKHKCRSAEPCLTVQNFAQSTPLGLRLQLGKVARQMSRSRLDIDAKVGRSLLSGLQSVLLCNGLWWRLYCNSGRTSRQPLWGTPTPQATKHFNKRY